ncbi:PorP/SprF family type IX secretion system membrane protein [Marivirga arenosa]|uniref:PorP/SprF family type IX secretion system membrane protein n=1 Tax=Marivirga arenosa TaxID=3059076 RepID=A0AA51ZW74_9BACT|nr:PorP/SprF family type IX secretion system membrane protein [Marivirga sp. BKB1-2]WNB17913.1 PorP/SprF family type IX secretion system membrane protein [Marivirga sp. BKB1-2]
MRKVIITLCLGITAGNLFGQSFMHSLFDYAPNRVNPAFASTDNYQNGIFIFRNQSASQDVNFMSSYAEVNQPFFNEDRRWSGISVSLMNDQTTGNNIYKLNQASVSYAISVPLIDKNELSFGLNSSFQSKSLNRQQLVTGSQYVEYFGFDSNLPSGESSGIINKNYFSFSFGFSWQKVDRYGKKLFTAGYSLQNLNRPEDSFNESNVNKLPFVNVLTGSATIFENYQWHLTQDVLFRHAGPSFEIITGPSIRYSMGNSATESIKSMLRYSTANNLMLGAVYDSKNYSVGGAFDINFFKNNISNHGTFEVVFSIKRLRRPKRKSKLTYGNREKISEEKENTIDNEIQDNESKESEKEEEDAIKVETKAGTITYLPHEFEDLSYVFKFDFDDIELTEEDEEYIYQMSELLKQSDRVKVLITGHTDNVGTEEYNKKLSFERAKMIGLILLNNGVSKRKIRLVSKGETEPISSNETAEGRAKNRRVQMQLIYQ